MPSNRMPVGAGNDRHLCRNTRLPLSQASAAAPALHQHYGVIGIPAVAAAARYHGEASREGEAKSYPDERFEETGK